MLVPALLLAASFGSASPIGSFLDSSTLIQHQFQASEKNITSTFILDHHLGNLSPYFSAPSNGYTTELPERCVVDQASLMHRHGARFPLVSELEYIHNVSLLFNNHPELLENVSDSFQFLKTWKNKLGSEDLTQLGRQELFDHGVQFNLSYPDLFTNVITSGSQDRVFESAEWFRMGYYGRDFSNRSTLTTLDPKTVPVSWIRPSDTCSLWKYSYGLQAVDDWNAIYLPSIVEKFDKALPGFNFTENNIHGMLYACAYETAYFGSTPWCQLFDQKEILDFEYELDLLMNYAFGYGLPGQLGPVLGSVYVNVLLDRLTNSTGNATELYLEFGHDTTIDLALTALNLAKDTPNIQSDHRNFTRQWQTSTQVPFGAQMITERIQCAGSTSESPTTWVRILLNDAPFPIVNCGGKINETTGACPLETFIEINTPSRKVTMAVYNQVCNNTAISS